MSALTGDATPVTSLPIRKCIATAVGALAAILPSIFCCSNVAELDDKFDPEFEDKFVGELVVRTGAVALTFV